MRLTVKQKRHLPVIFNFLALGVLFGISIAVTLQNEISLFAFKRGALMGFLISFFSILGNYSFLLYFRKLPFSVYILIKTIYFSLIGVTIVLIGIQTIGERPPGFNRSTIVVIIVFFTLLISLFFNLILFFQRMIGVDVLRSFLSGKYHKPREEIRIFMFLDLVSSTEIAEKIGSLKFHNFLNEVFYDITNAILNAGGEIYKYVGDEIIVNWKKDIGLKDNHCVEMFFDVKRILIENAPKYNSKYKVLPNFRAGLHMGKVIVGELGDYKREISFLGDTVNTTARIQDTSKKEKKGLLVSEKILKQLSVPQKYHTEYLGPIELRGKKEKVELYHVYERQ
jgi:adenylate cyclase